MLAANMQQTSLRLELLTKQYGENEAAQNLAGRAAKRFGLSQKESLDGITDIYARLRPIGISLKEIETTYMGFNIATKLAGVNAAQASGAFLQLSQALGSGRLQGDEYRSIAEQLPTLTQAIAKEMGKPIGQLKKLASEGKITSEVVIKALENIEKEGGASIDKIMKKDATQQFKNLQNAVSDLSAELGEYLVPATVAATQALTEAVRWVSDLPDPVKASAVAVGALTTAVGIIIPLGFKAYRLMRVIRVFMLRKLIPTIGLTKAAMGPLAVALSLATVALVGIGNQFVKAKRKGEEWNEFLQEGTKISKAARLEALETQLLEKQQTKITEGGRSGRSKRKELKKDIEDLTTKITELKDQIKIDVWTEENARIEKTNAAIKALGETTKQTSEQFQLAFTNKFQSYLTTVNDFGAQAGSAVVRAFQGMEDALVSFVRTGKLDFKSLADSIIADLIRIQVRQAVVAPLARMMGGGLSSLWSKGTNVQSTPFPLVGGDTWNTDMGVNDNPIWGRRAGGPVSAGRSYLVGEKGPEIFTPRSSGNITANDKIGGGTMINVSVNATESKVSANGGEAKQLGESIATAIQQQLVKERRPGGLLYT